MKCIICGEPVEQWPGGGGYGHNPDPVSSIEAAARISAVIQNHPVGAEVTPDEVDLVTGIVAQAIEGRACNWCNENVVIPVRLRRAGSTAAATAYPSIVKDA